MNWFPADYVLFSVAAVAAIIGLFIGFSGALAFLSATVVSALAGKFGWLLVAGYCSTTWQCTLVTVLIVLLTFGLVRWLVKKLVGGLLKQPADAVFGAVTAALAGFGIAGIIVYLLNFFQVIQIQSVLVSEAIAFA